MCGCVFLCVYVCVDVGGGGGGGVSTGTGPKHGVRGLTVRCWFWWPPHVHMQATGCCVQPGALCQLRYVLLAFMPSDLHCYAALPAVLHTLWLLPNPAAAAGANCCWGALFIAWWLLLLYVWWLCQPARLPACPLPCLPARLLALPACTCLPACLLPAPICLPAPPLLLHTLALCTAARCVSPATRPTMLQC